MTTKAIATTPTEVPIRLTRRFSVEEYYRMAKAGILREGDRVELIDGRIVEMGPIGSEHSGSVKAVNQLFRRLDGSRVQLASRTLSAWMMAQNHFPTFPYWLTGPTTTGMNIPLPQTFY